VLLGKGTEVRLADAGLARFMHRDYMAAESSVGPFTWTVRPPLGRLAPGWGCPVCQLRVCALPTAYTGSLGGSLPELLDFDMMQSRLVKQLQGAKTAVVAVRRRQRSSTACRRPPPPTSGPWASCCTSC
jgi:hypothetical protein